MARGLGETGVNMGEESKALTQHYVCPKCRGRAADVREVAFSKSGLLDLLPSKDNRYIEVTCTLCGYTEFYSRAIYIAAHARTGQPAEVPLPKQANGG